MAWRWSVCGTAEVVWKPRFLWQWPSASSAFFGLLFLIFLLTIPHRFSIGFRSGEFCWPVQAHKHHGHLTNFWCFWQSGQVPNPAGNEISSFKKLVSRRKQKCSKFSCKRVQWRWFSKKHNGPTPVDYIAPQIITDCGNLTLDFMQLGLWASPTLPPDSRTLVSKWNTNLLSSEKRTLDHWATVQFLVA